MKDIKKGILIGVGCCIAQYVMYLVAALLLRVAKDITDICEQGPKATEFSFKNEQNETVVVGFRGTES